MRNAQSPAPEAADARRIDRSSEILAAARTLFVSQGGAHATMAEIARHIGVAEGTLYLYFQNKRALIIAVAAQWFDEIVVATEHEARAIDDPLDLLRFLVQRHLDVIVRNKEMYLTLMREVRAGDNYSTSQIREINRRYTSLLRPILDRAAAPMAVRTARDLIYGGVEHVAWTALIRDPTTFDSAAHAREIADGFARMLGIAASGDRIEERLARIEAKLGLSNR